MNCWLLQVVTGYCIKIKLAAYWWQFLLGIVNISSILSRKIPKYTITNAIYFDWRFTLVWLRDVFKQYFDEWLVLFKQQDGNFFWNRKLISQQSIYDVHMEGDSHMRRVLKLNGLQIQSLVVVVSSSTSSHKLNKFWLHRDNITTPSPLPQHSFLSHYSTNDRTKVPVTFIWHLIFYVKKYFGLLNIASWMPSNKPLWTRNCDRCS